MSTDPEQQYGRGANADEAIETVRRIYEAFARRDIEAALAFTAPDVEMWPNGTSSILGRVEPYRGHEGVRQYFADAERVWQDIRISAEDYRATGGGVVVFGRVEGVAEGQPIARRAVWVWRVRDGLARSMRVNDTGDDAPAVDQEGGRLPGVSGQGRSFGMSAT